MPAGKLYIATDCDDYAQNILNAIEDEELLENMAEPGCYAQKKSRRTLTKYEARGLQCGHQIRDIHARRL